MRLCRPMAMRPMVPVMVGRNRIRVGVVGEIGVPMQRHPACCVRGCARHCTGDRTPHREQYGKHQQKDDAKKFHAAAV